MVTSPALPLSKLDRERGVVDAEHMERNVGNLLFALDQQIFPSRNRGQTVIGTRDSRADILADDIRTFYEENYLAMNAAIVVTGDFTIDEVKSVLARGLKWPPRVQPKPAEEPASPNVPSQTKALSWVTATAAAYLADGMDRQVCDAIGALIDMRLRRKLLVEESGASWTTVFCHENRGHKFLVSLAFTTTSAGNQLPTVMKALFADARRAPPTVAEKALLESHGKAIFGLMLARAPTLADALAKGAASANQSIEKGVEAELTPPRFDWPSMQQALTTSITEQNFVLIHFSPYEES
jgi:hypothetical protein